MNKNIKVRKKWSMNPLTRIKENKKRYKRQKFKTVIKDYLEDLDYRYTR